MRAKRNRGGDEPQRSIKVLRLAALLLLAAITMALIAWSYWRDPFDPALEGTARYGHNHEGALLQGIGVTAVELAVLVAILRPWSYHRSWQRALGALGLFFPWLLFSAMLTMHAGGVMMFHLLWLLVVTAALVVGWFWSSIAAARHRSVRQPGPTT